jgi:hypothetical protein
MSQIPPKKLQKYKELAKSDPISSKIPKSIDPDEYVSSLYSRAREELLRHIQIEKTS